MDQILDHVIASRMPVGFGSLVGAELLERSL
jgi:hypothetical protein